jgi:hypothetical protein
MRINRRLRLSALAAVAVLVGKWFAGNYIYGIVGGAIGSVLAGLLKGAAGMANAYLFGGLIGLGIALGLLTGPKAWDVRLKWRHPAVDHLDEQAPAFPEHRLELKEAWHFHDDERDHALGKDLMVVEMSYTNRQPDRKVNLNAEIYAQIVRFGQTLGKKSRLYWVKPPRLGDQLQFPLEVAPESTVTGLLVCHVDDLHFQFGPHHHIYPSWETQVSLVLEDYVSSEQMEIPVPLEMTDETVDIEPEDSQQWGESSDWVQHILVTNRGRRGKFRASVTSDIEGLDRKYGKGMRLLWEQSNSDELELGRNEQGRLRLASFQWSADRVEARFFAIPTSRHATGTGYLPTQPYRIAADELNFDLCLRNVESDEMWERYGRVTIKDHQPLLWLFKDKRA